MNCKNKNLVLLEEIQSLIEQEKFETALLKAKEKLESQKISDEILSTNKPKNSRILELSNDRNRVVWTEDSKIIFRDLANPMIKTKEMGTPPKNLSISNAGNYAVVSLQANNPKYCKLRVISLVESRPDYTVASFTNCNDKSSISTTGETVYFFIKNSLYKENIQKYNSPTLIAAKDVIESPFPKISNKNLMYPIDKSFLIFSGNAGAYNLYWFNPKDNRIEKLLSDVIIPEIYYGNGSNLYIFTGNIGSISMKEIIFGEKETLELKDGFETNIFQMNPWETTKREEFLSGTDGRVFVWGPKKEKSYYPIICKRFWGVARGQIIYENKNGELILSNMVFTEEEWKYLEMYEEILKKKEQN